MLKLDLHYLIHGGPGNLSITIVMDYLNFIFILGTGKSYIVKCLKKCTRIQFYYRLQGIAVSNLPSARTTHSLFIISTVGKKEKIVEINQFVAHMTTDRLNRVRQRLDISTVVFLSSMKFLTSLGQIANRLLMSSIFM